MRAGRRLLSCLPRSLYTVARDDYDALGADPKSTEWAVDLFVQVAKEVQDLFLPHAPLVRPKVELPQSHPCSDGEVIPIELVLQEGRNAALGPCAHPMRSLAEAAFVY